MDIGIWVVASILAVSAIYVMSTDKVSIKGNTTKAPPSKTNTTKAPPSETQTTTDSAPSVLAGDPDEDMHDGGTFTDPPPKEESDDSPAATMSTAPDTTKAPSVKPAQVRVRDNHGAYVYVNANLPPGMESRPDMQAAAQEREEEHEQPSQMNMH
jgi:hypothetical protein